MTKKIPLPAPVAKIYAAVAELEAMYQGRRFTPDGHLVGSIGEVIVAEAFDLTLHPASYPNHDAFNADGDVQIKAIGPNARGISLYAECARLIVVRILPPTEAEVLYDGPGKPVWETTGRIGKNGQKVVRLTRLAKIAAEIQTETRR